MDSNHIIRLREDVEHFLSKLIYALKDEHIRINLKISRKSELHKEIRYTNRYTVNDLAPDFDTSKFLKQELKKIDINEYMYCLKDETYPDRDDLYVFSRKYGEKGYVYIKPRINLLTASGTEIVVISFHYSKHEITREDFPYKE